MGVPPDGPRPCGGTACTVPPYLAYSENLDKRCHGGDRGQDHGPELDGQPILQFPQIGLGRHLGFHMGFGKRLGDGLGLLFRKTGLAQFADELVGIEGDGGHVRSQHSDGCSSGSTSMLSYVSELPRVPDHLQCLPWR